MRDIAKDYLKSEIVDKMTEKSIKLMNRYRDL
jgi:hypothetical protein